MEAHKFKERGINDIGFLDPTSINEAIVGFRSTVNAGCDALVDMQDKKWILLPYNHQCMYPNSYIYFHLTIIRVSFILDVLNVVTIIFSLGST
jgi:hypothetical protein